MGALLDVYLASENKKRCTVCGCIMDKDHESDICEICFDEMCRSEPGEPVEDYDY